ncbi:hypothetical protein QYE76_036397 [Lolium multiflorum]|uniref:Ribonuclease H1 N-terminal domain-containing protein n=1 Tax=Lolium multiflorum TaxID=4521 RepID=A0AAD8VN22_LOLMU|nr:hypothetical protein QYE76_036397 [Lolium multiflorum]
MAPLDSNDVDDDSDIDAYIDMAPCDQDMYMPPMDEQAFRTHGDQLTRPPTVTKQCLVFTGLSQDTPPEAGNPAQVKPAPVFSPNTLRKTIIGEPPKSTPATSEAPPAPEAPPSAPQAPPVGQVKKGRKRGAKKGASSKPAPKRIRADDMVPPTPDGLPRCHEAGKPILPLDMEHLASGQMLPLQHSIHYQESVLLKEKDPLPGVLGQCLWVNLRDEDQREKTPPHRGSGSLLHSQLRDGSRTRTKAVRYLENFMLMHKESNTILLAVFPEALPKRDIEERLHRQGDGRTWTTKDLYKPFPEQLKKASQGRVPGVYEEWEECKKQVHKFSGNCYKGYPTRHEAVAKWRAHQANKSKMKAFLVLCSCSPSSRYSISS